MIADPARRLGLTPWAYSARHARRAHSDRLRRLTLLLLAAAAVVPADMIAGTFAPVLAAAAAAAAALVLVAIWRWRHRARQLEQILSDELDHRHRT
ncbi:hypothetical protein [Amycolatopsis sp. DG1A-15b]|uniref:hypothetical protein n=1 Tax=Amycolatopsis sp. DG1A-15b TaxID=3052846 RepID=UPI00255B86D6|nr:hypothetical protein [Amycolatopsis sp. DG1A-15b]WIX92442.1 hypothetical protein QRY02_19185 [Amycolatopsis sp. DG1A-15b]